MIHNQWLPLLTGGQLLLASCGVFGQPTAPQTITYRLVDGCRVQADIYGATTGTRKPCVLWIHGGALIMGSRKGLGGRFTSELLRQGYVLVSIDYRLAPETKLPDIIDDVRQAWQWLRTEGSARFGIDPNRVAVAGGSAGGYLTLMSGFCLEPRPRALVSYYGYGDITTPWYAQPDDFYRRQPLVSKQEAFRAVGGSVLAEPPASNQRGRFYLYCRQNGLWPAEVAGHDPQREPRFFDPYCPSRNVTAKYPPTLLIHGTEDTDVPYAESKNMVAKLAAAGVEHQFITVVGAGHGLRGGKPEEVTQADDQAVEFVKAHTR